MKRFSFFLASLLLLSSLSYGVQYSKRHHGGGYSRGGLGSVLSILSLTTAQTTAISTLRLTLRANMSALKASRTPAIQSGVASGDFVKSDYIDAINSNHQAKSELQGQYMEDVYNLLDDTQKAIFITNVNLLTY